MVQNIPIRLVHSDGNITEIFATDVALDVERKTGGIPIPFAGSKRGGFDFNLSNATIIINGIISDTNLGSNVNTSVAASATVDFSVSWASATYNGIAPSSWIPDNDDANTLTLVGTTRVTATNTEDAKVILVLNDTDGTEYKIAFVSNAGAVANHWGYDSGSGMWYIGIYNHSGSVKGTNVEIADNLFDVINDTGLAVRLDGKFTATKEESTITDEANTVVRITQVTTGMDGNKQSPSITGTSRNGQEKIPYVRRFSGGKGNEGVKSAGDRVMDLYGILNNSDNATIVSRIQAIGKAKKWEGGIGAIRGNQFGDYITGIQIPFNSLYHAGASEQYNVRNFWMPTGAKYMAWEKGSEKAEAGMVEFDADERNAAGIKGTVQKATFTQLGGEPIWTFTIVFAPIDLIW